MDVAYSMEFWYFDRNINITVMEVDGYFVKMTSQLWRRSANREPLIIQIILVKITAQRKEVMSRITWLRYCNSNINRYILLNYDPDDVENFSICEAILFCIGGWGSHSKLKKGGGKNLITLLYLFQRGKVRFRLEIKLT